MVLDQWDFSVGSIVHNLNIIESVVNLLDMLLFC